MTWYHASKLKAMALAVLTAELENDERYFTFMMTMSLRTGLEVGQIKQKILRLAGK